MAMEAMKGKITFIRVMDLKILCHKEYHLTLGIKVLLMAIAFHVMNLVTKPWSADIMQKEGSKISTTQLDDGDAIMLVTLLHISIP